MKYMLATIILVCLTVVTYEVIYAYLTYLLSTDTNPASWGTDPSYRFRITGWVGGSVFSLVFTWYLVSIVDEIVRERRHNKATARARDAERIDFEKKWAEMMPDLQKKN